MSTMTAPMMTAETVFDPVEFRRTLGHFATGVTVVTYDYEGEACGATVNSFTSVSLEPPLILVSLANGSRAASRILDRPFAVNILHRDQEDLAMQFAGRPQAATRPEWNFSPAAPVLAGSLATVVCQPWETHQAGDHVLVLGRVEEFSSVTEEPLIFYRGAFTQLGAAPEVTTKETRRGETR